jgi:hypothetical protein
MAKILNETSPLSNAVTKFTINPATYKLAIGE